jgi:hypothetical protein
MEQKKQENEVNGNNRAVFRELLDIYYADGFEAMLEKVKELSGDGHPEKEESEV